MDGFPRKETNMEDAIRNMELMFARCKTILKKLPMSYYGVSKEIDVQMDKEAETSFFAPVTGEIHISFSNVLSALSQALKRKTSFGDETTVRTLLYHETLHVLLTPTIISKWGGWSDWLNIMEDERIEEIGEGFFLDTDFPKMKVLLNGYTGKLDPHASTLSAFFFTVRFKHAPKGMERFVNMVDEWIEHYKTLNESSYNDVGSFYEDANRIWLEFAREYGRLEKEREKCEKSKADSKGTGDSADANDEGSDSEEAGDSAYSDKEKKSSKEAGDSAARASIIKAASSKIKKREREAFMHGSTFDLNVERGRPDPKTMQELEKILHRRIDLSGRESSASVGRLGKIEPRLVGRKACEDYRWFLRGVGGNQRMGRKLHMRLVIDNSGSFMDNDDVMRRFLAAINAYRKNNSDSFSFEVMTVNESCVMLDPSSLEFRSFGGNTIPRCMPGMYKKMFEPDSKNVTIVLFDGDMFTDCSDQPLAEKRVAEMWNDPSCIVLSDADNDATFMRCCPRAHYKAVDKGRYAEAFISETLNMLALCI
jgi:hypothetical protein